MTGNSLQAEREQLQGLEAPEPVFVNAAHRLVQRCVQGLSVGLVTADFEGEFTRVCHAIGM